VTGDDACSASGMIGLSQSVQHLIARHFSTSSQHSSLSVHYTRRQDSHEIMFALYLLN